MKPTTLFEFESAAFSVRSGEDLDTNPGIHGEALASWLAEQLRALGHTPGALVAEDFGWCIPIESRSHRLFVACAGSAVRGAWRVYAFVEGGLLARLLGRDQGRQALARLHAAVRQSLANHPGVRDLREVPG